MHPPAEQSKAPTTWELIQYSDAAVIFFLAELISLLFICVKVFNSLTNRR